MVNYRQARQEILEWVAEAIQKSPEEVDTTKPLSELGIDSLDAVHLIATIESTIRQELPEDVIQRVGSLDAIFELMADRLAAA